jgi:hypothetical protein
MLREFKYHSQAPLRNVPCSNPYHCEPKVEALDVSKRITDKRSYLCKYVRRLIGHYKIVFFMQVGH